MQETVPAQLAQALREQFPAIMPAALAAPAVLPPAGCAVAAPPADDGSEQVTIPRGYLEYLESMVMSYTATDEADGAVAAAPVATGAPPPSTLAPPPAPDGGPVAAPRADGGPVAHAVDAAEAGPTGAALPSIALAAMQHLRQGGAAKAV